MKKPIEMDGLGVPLFLETPIYIYIYTWGMPKFSVTVGKSSDFLDLNSLKENPLLQCFGRTQDINVYIYIYVYIYVYVDSLYDMFMWLKL